MVQGERGERDPAAQGRRRRATPDDERVPGVARWHCPRRPSARRGRERSPPTLFRLGVDRLPHPSSSATSPTHPGGRLLATGSDDPRIRVWDTATSTSPARSSCLAPRTARSVWPTALTALVAALRRPHLGLRSRRPVAAHLEHGTCAPRGRQPCHLARRRFSGGAIDGDGVDRDTNQTPSRERRRTSPRCSSGTCAAGPASPASKIRTTSSSTSRSARTDAPDGDGQQEPAGPGADRQADRRRVAMAGARLPAGGRPIAARVRGGQRPGSSARTAARSRSPPAPATRSSSAPPVWPRPVTSGSTTMRSAGSPGPRMAGPSPHRATRKATRSGSGTSRAATRWPRPGRRATPSRI